MGNASLNGSNDKNASTGGGVNVMANMGSGKAVVQAALDLMQWDLLESNEAMQISEEGKLFLQPDSGVHLQFPGVTKPNHWYQHGFVAKNDYSVDLTDWYGLEVEMALPVDEVLELKVEIGRLVNKSPLPEEMEFASYTTLVSGKGAHRLLLPFRLFDDAKSLFAKWRFVRSVRISGQWLSAGAEPQPDGLSIEAGLEAGLSPAVASDPSADLPAGADALAALSESNGQRIELTRLCFRRRKTLYLHTPVLSKSADIGDMVSYDVTVANCTDQMQAVKLSTEHYGGETMSAALEPSVLLLAPGASGQVQVSVEISERMAPGGFEKQIIHAVPNGRGDEGELLELTTLRKLPPPFVLMQEAEWQEVREKVEKDAAMRELLGMYMQRAEAWEVPEIFEGEPFLFETHHSHEAHNAVVVWKVTGRPEFAEKAALFLKRLIHPENGYAVTMRACNQQLVHEGEFFKHMAVVYDLLGESAFLSEEDRRNTEICFRLYMDLIDWSMGNGDISNWSLAELAGALYCSQTLQDRERMNRFLYGVGGLTDQLSKGTLDDGWWYECSVGYNLMAAGLFTEVSQSLRPWGINFADIWVPATYSARVTPGGSVWFDGLSLDIWGPNTKNYRSITMLWDSLMPYADYRGVIFGFNDAAELMIPGISPRGYMDARLDLAYHLYRKPEYGSMLRHCPLEERDLLFAATELPEAKEKPYTTSTYSDNAGAVVLRSQTEGREPREQIQAVLKYGSHGGAHGHYDRVSLVSLMRYGKSFYNPESIWYNYLTFMYKFYVQNSITHNMVTVDLKQQDPSEGRRLLFHSGKLFQAAAVENVAKWCNPPYGGWTVKDDKTFAERAWNEGRYVPIPDNPPEYTRRTEFTEPVLQRRMAVVTDDYVILFDYVSGEEEHVYDCLFHIKGLQSLEASEGKRYKGHTEQLDPNPLSSAQFITDCDWYDMSGSVRASFEMGFGEDADNEGNRTFFNEDGMLKMDVHSLWPLQKETIVATDPEYFKVEKQLTYTVEADGEKLAEGQLGAWILGRHEIDVDIKGREALQLKVHVAEVLGEHDAPIKTLKTVFWGDPYLVTEDGSMIYFLADLPLEYANTDEGCGAGLDYAGGPVKIQAKRYDRAIPAQPKQLEDEGRITVDLSGLQAVRFVAAIGGDYPLGDETYRRKMLSFRQQGKYARFTSIMEAYEEQAMIVKAEAISADEMVVELADGRKQEIQISGMESADGMMAVIVREYDASGRLLREETTSAEQA